MNRYSVVSTEEADSDLATIWAGFRDRGRVAEAADSADRTLATDPIANAKHLSEGLWLLRKAPLRFYFTISEEDRLVRITAVRFDLPT